jgi:hypothetical protein
MFVPVVLRLTLSGRWLHICRHSGGRPYWIVGAMLHDSFLCIAALQFILLCPLLLCPLFCVPCFVSPVLCPLFCVPCFVSPVLCPLFCVPCFVSPVLCPLLLCRRIV